jgi:hypothetical protein
MTERKPTACKGCGQVFTWAQLDGKWRLVNRSGKRHRCQLYRALNRAKRAKRELDQSSRPEDHRPSI